MTRLPHALRYFVPGWYALVMGVSGLALAWHQAARTMGPAAEGIALVLAGAAALVFAVLAAATVLRGLRHPQAWAEDRRHPVRHTFVATLPISMILLATLAVVLFGAHPLAAALWWAGSLAQLWVTWWVLGRWWAALPWASVTPALFIPVVGNVLVPLAGVPLGFETWAAAQFGVGLLFWPVVTVLLLVRIASHGAWPERLKPTVFILIAPPAVIGLAALRFGAPPAVAWMLWGAALFSFAWVGKEARAIAALPFSLPHWALSFPLAALAALTLRLAAPGSAAEVLGLALLALATLVVAALVLGTWRGLRDGSLLAPEPVAAIQPAS
jgi:tellurite resistance protein